MIKIKFQNSTIVLFLILIFENQYTSRVQGITQQSFPYHSHRNKIFKNFFKIQSV